MFPALVRSPAWMRTSPDGMSYVLVWVSLMHTIRIGGVLGAGDDWRRLESRQSCRIAHFRGALSKSWRSVFGSKSLLTLEKNLNNI